MSHRPSKTDQIRSRSDDEVGGGKRGRSQNRRRHDGASVVRVQLAREAARLISVGEAGDYPQARRKAAQRLGVLDKAMLPANQDIDEALREYQRLFKPQTGELSKLYREAALEAMDFLAHFHPLLTGPVLEATVDEHAVVTLHLHHDDPDAVGHDLVDQGIAPDSGTVRLRLDPRRSEEFPIWRFSAGEVPFELVILPSLLARQAPLAPGDEQPMRRASAAQLRRLMADEEVYGDTAGR